MDKAMIEHMKFCVHHHPKSALKMHLLYVTYNDVEEETKKELQKEGIL